LLRLLYAHATLGTAAIFVGGVKQVPPRGNARAYGMDCSPLSSRHARRGTRAIRPFRASQIRPNLALDSGLAAHQRLKSGPMPGRGAGWYRIRRWRRPGARYADRRGCLRASTPTTRRVDVAAFPPNAWPPCCPALHNLGVASYNSAQPSPRRPRWPPSSSRCTDNSRKLRPNRNPPLLELNWPRQKLCWRARRNRKKPFTGARQRQKLHSIHQEEECCNDRRESVLHGRWGVPEPGRAPLRRREFSSGRVCGRQGRNRCSNQARFLVWFGPPVRPVAPSPYWEMLGPSRQRGTNHADRSQTGPVCCARRFDHLISPAPHCYQTRKAA